ncbi:hypothetical protein [Nonomuraea candida]|uniref:hypothetical protein n=1 Tax=Nonomuraea candida TaxID=359159 RepID=UPI0012FB843F|nr:hypothetical protein [Nonomuraea candida]
MSTVALLAARLHVAAREGRIDAARKGQRFAHKEEVLVNSVDEDSHGIGLKLVPDKPSDHMDRVEVSWFKISGTKCGVWRHESASHGATEIVDVVERDPSI